MQLPESAKQAAREAAYEAGFGTGRGHINRIVNAALAAIEDHPDMNLESSDKEQKSVMTHNLFHDPPRYIQ
jgi:hypothetical protein